MPLVVIVTFYVCSSGESGAGKTESCKFMIAQLVELSQGKTTLEQSIIKVMCVCVCVCACVRVFTSAHM